MKEEEKIENDRVKRRNPATEEKIMLKYTIPKETIHFLRFPKLMYYQMGVHPPSNTKVKSWGYIYIWWSIGKHQWSWSHIWYPNVYIWRFPQIGLPCTTQHPRHGWSEGPGHLTTRTESPAPAARSPRSQPLGPCWLFFFCHFLNQQPWLMVDDECSTMAVDDI